jgi:ATP-binding cassette subfamily C (CFTR/MRP) protein 1
MDKPHNKKRFDDALKYAALKDDIKILLHGLNTQIGDKGVNLSGG